MSSDLAGRFRRLMAEVGPISVTRFMGESNAHYYASRNPLGARGDFVTAPEISQMFGELAGLWLADLWDRAGQPADAIYAELGPGRGTLAKDALRAMARVGWCPAVHLVEGSPALRELQAEALPDAVFHDDASSLPGDRPLLLLANEFLDALPVRQFVRTEAGWRELMVGLEGDRFAFVAGSRPPDSAIPASFAASPPGTIIETNPAAAAVTDEIARRLVRQGGAALFIDYGHLDFKAGSSLQAVRTHRTVDPLDHPGEADITAHVDFAATSDIARASGCRVQSAKQGDWLEAMGIGPRAEALARAAPERGGEIAMARERLTSCEHMGELFKVMAISAPDWPRGAGFAP